jgi:hypothetical protein
LWAGGILLIAVWFGIMEGIAKANAESGDTLSEAIWDHSHLPAVVVFLLVFLVMGLTFWFGIHIVTKGKI